MNRYIGYVNITLPIYCIAEDSDDAIIIIEDNMEQYLTDAYGNSLHRICKYAEVKSIEYDGIANGQFSKTSYIELTNHDNIYAVAVEASKNYLLKKGYSILSTNNDENSVINCVCVGPITNDVVFVNVLYDNEELPQESFDREISEKDALNWLVHQSSYKIVDRKIRFDIICICKAHSDNALLRHHTNVGSIN